MKTLFLTFAFVISSVAFANTSHYNILEGKLHKGGSLTVEVLPHDTLFLTKMSYKIVKKKLAPIPSEFLQGSSDLELPVQFRDERGYLELEKLGSMEIEKARLNYLGRTACAGFQDCHKVEVLPQNGKSKTHVVYHPTLPGVGWSSVKVVFLMDIPLLKNYTLIAEKI